MTAYISIVTDPFTSTLAGIAGRLKAARSVARLSLDQLAVRSGVSKGSLVKLESGTGNPSIGVLCQVAAAIGVSLSDLLSSPETREATVFGLKDGTVAWTGSQGGSARLVMGSAGPDMVELWEWELFPGERYEAVTHSQGTKEVIVVRSGVLGISLTDREFLVRAGEGILAGTDVPHAYWCSGGRAVRFQMFVSEVPR